MKVAISFSGKRGFTEGRDGLGKKLNLEITYYHLKRHILDKFNTDIFIHTWGQNEEEYMKKIFKPKKIYSEPQEYFGLNIENLSTNEKNDEFGIGAEFRIFSKMTSFVKSLDLVSEYEKKNNFKYDYIICLRLDTLFLKNIKLNKLKKNKIYVQNKVYHDGSVNLNFKNNFHHSRFIFVLNSDHLKKSNYKDIYSFTFHNKKNRFQHCRPAWGLEPLEKEIFKNSIVEPSLPLWLTKVNRRVYTEKEYAFVKGKKNEYLNLTKKELEFNEYVFSTLYKKDKKFNYFFFLTFYQIITKRIIYNFRIHFFVLKSSVKINTKKILPKFVFNKILILKRLFLK